MSCHQLLSILVVLIPINVVFHVSWYFGFKIVLHFKRLNFVHQRVVVTVIVSPNRFLCFQIKFFELVFITIELFFIIVLLLFVSLLVRLWRFWVFLFCIYRGFLWNLFMLRVIWLFKYIFFFIWLFNLVLFSFLLFLGQFPFNFRLSLILFFNLFLSLLFFSSQHFDNNTILLL